MLPSQPPHSRSSPQSDLKLKLNHPSQASTTKNQPLQLARRSSTQRVLPSEDATQQNRLFKQTASKLTKSNFEPHHHSRYLQEECNCGRHLSKLHVIKPDLTKSTHYRNTFHHFTRIPNTVVYDKEHDKLKGPHLDLNSTYSEGFRGKEGDKIERPKPQDLIKSSGPCPNLSSYSSHFPGHRGKNQYVKPTDKHTREQLPLRSSSTYTREFVARKQKKDDYKYIPDQLRTGSRWFGKTTYGDFFNNPNPEYMAQKAKRVEKLDQKHHFSHQFGTLSSTQKPPTYKNDFIRKDTPVCPAKIHLQTTAQGRFQSSTGSFAENCDFKALSPRFHAIATSRHSFI